MTKIFQEPKLKTRPPIVVILGHVDHGKTTLLDYIRKTKITETEAGGITQHIGAYQINHEGKQITFIDTPGHEAFGKMRSRGAKVADVAVLVVAAEESIKPQTEESIKHIQDAGIPFVVALTKIDKPDANPEKVKKDLGMRNMLIEEWGGKIPLVSVSAKTGEGMPELLEMILLLAEMEELKADMEEPFSGIVIESFMDKERGPTITLVVKNGTLKNNDRIRCGKIRGSAKIIENFCGQTIDKAFPSMPIRIIGVDNSPEVGEKCVFDTGEKLSETSETDETAARKTMLTIGSGKDFKDLHLILKADTFGSLEAILNSLEDQKSEEVAIELLKKEIGEINETDIKIARASNAIIVSFNLDVSGDIKGLAERNDIKIISGNVIYELIDKIKKEMSMMIETETVRSKIGQLKVLAVFRTEKRRMIVGGKVTDGFVKNKAEAEVVRDDKIIGKGKIIQLKKDKTPVEKMEKPNECGILFEGEPIIKEGDVLEIYTEERIKRSL